MVNDASYVASGIKTERELIKLFKEFKILYTRRARDPKLKFTVFELKVQQSTRFLEDTPITRKHQTKNHHPLKLKVLTIIPAQDHPLLR